MPETPEQWRDHLLKKLADRVPSILRAHRYYAGDHDLPRLPDNCNNAIKELRQGCVLNLIPSGVKAVIDRLEVQGFQFGEGEPALDVWHDTWQHNHLDADSDLVHSEALIARRSFVLVWPNEAGAVEITPESPLEMIVDYVPGSRRKRRAALKCFVDGEGSSKITDVTLWLPGQVYRWQRMGNRDWVAVVGSTGPTPALLGQEIPVVEFLCNPDLSGVPHSELDLGVIAIQDRINKTIFDRLVLGEYQAFPQRWATGVAPAVDADGNPTQPFHIGPNKLVTNESPDVRFGQWDAANMDVQLKAVEEDIKGYAMTSLTPMYYFASQLSNVSAEMLQALDAGHIKKVRRYFRFFGEYWEEVVRLDLMLKGDPRASDQSSMIEWADPEIRTQAEMADATVKLAPLLPRDETWRRLGYVPQERQRFREEMATEALMDIPAVSPPPEPAPVG